MNNPVDVPWYEQFFGEDYFIFDTPENTAEEVLFLREVLMLRKGTRLLDAPCGYGRHLIPLVRRKVDAVGCDLSPEMLAEASRKLGKKHGTRLIRCDLRNLPFTGVFDCACTMFNSFGYFEREQDNFRVLTEIGKALKPGGLFLLDIVNRDFLIRHFCRLGWLEKNGTIILEEKQFDSVRSRTEVDVTLIDKQGKRKYHHSIRVYSLTEISMLLEAAGFIVAHVFGGLQFEELTIDSDRMLILSQVRTGGIE